MSATTSAEQPAAWDARAAPLLNLDDLVVRLPVEGALRPVLHGVSLDGSGRSGSRIPGRTQSLPAPASGAGVSRSSRNRWRSSWKMRPRIGRWTAAPNSGRTGGMSDGREALRRQAAGAGL